MRSPDGHRELAAHITAFGAAFPATVDQNDLWDGYFRTHFHDSRIAARVFAAAGVRQRHTVLDRTTDHDIATWSTATRMRRYAECAPPLAHEAVATALTRAGLVPEEIGQLVVASCTGYGGPGLDVQLVRSLPLRADVRRLLVGHMGCYAALPALAAADDFVVAHGRPAVVLCLELTTLHIQPPTTDPEQVVCHALFSDAATAMVVAPGPATSTPGLRLVDTTAVTDHAAGDRMTWEVTDLGFRLGLSRTVPEVLAGHVVATVDTLLTPHGLAVPDVRGWAVHPGGPRILDAVRERLRLPESAMAASRHVLAEHGNCSSATVPLVLRYLTEQPLRDEDPVVALAFGPGLTITGMLFRVQRHA